MKASQIAVVGLGAAIMVAFLAYPAFAQTASTSTSSTSTSSAHPGPLRGVIQGFAKFFAGHGGPLMGGSGFGPFGGPGARSGAGTTFTTGQTITLTSTSGMYYVVGTQGKTNGTASGTLTLTVTGALRGGYVLNIGGSLTVAGTSYTVSSGSGVMGPGGANIQGEGATSSSGTFILRASARGNFSGTDSARVSLDFSNGTAEYVVSLTSTIAG